MITLHELIKVITISFFTCCVLDFLFIAIIGENKTARWYLIHAIINTIVTFLVIPDMILLLKDPINGLNNEYSDVPLAMTVGMHLFHCISSYKTLSAIDWIHHLISNMLVCGLCFPFHYGPLVNWAAFFVCGFPGGIDYYLLFLSKMKIINSITEKKYNRILNIWIRAPGIIMFMPFAWTCYVYGKTNVPFYILVTQGILNVTNGLYFADRVVENHAVIDWCARHNIDKKNVEQVKKILAKMELDGSGSSKTDKNK